MKVTLLTNLVPPYRFDACNALHGLVQNAGGGLTVICTNRTEPQRKWPEASGDFHHQTLAGLVLPLCENRTFSIPISTVKALRSSSPDALILNGFGIAQWQASRWAHAHSIPTIIQFDGWAGSDETYANPIRKHMRRQMIAKADGFVAASSRGKAWFAQFGAAKTDILIAPIPTSFPAPQTIPDFAERLYDLTWCGRTTRSKGFDVFINVAAELKECGPLKKLAIIGCTDIEQVQHDVTALGLDDLAEIHPQLSPSDLPKFLCNSKLCLFPSRNDAYGVGVIEAISCGAVALASSMVGSSPDCLGTSEIIDVVVPNSWVAASHKLLTDPAWWQRTQQLQTAKIRSNTPSHQAQTLWQALQHASAKTTGLRQWN